MLINLKCYWQRRRWVYFYYEIWNTKICESIRIKKFGEIQVNKENFYEAKEPMKNWEVDIKNSIL